MTKHLTVELFFEPVTGTASYLIYDAEQKVSATIDVVLNYEPASARTSTESADAIIARIKALSLTNLYIMETHAHADHLSAGHYMRNTIGGKTVIGENITKVQSVFQSVYNLKDDFTPDGSQFDVLLKEGESLTIGRYTLKAMPTPGHTPACMTYLIDNCAFMGDTLFQPDYGTARCDFPGGDATTLYQSIQKILALPDDTRLFTGHDYPPKGRDYAVESTPLEQRKNNIHVGKGVDEKSFVTMRETRDKTLDTPRLLLPSLQVNIRGGQLPNAEDNGQVYFKLPVNFIGNNKT